MRALDHQNVIDHFFELNSDMTSSQRLEASRIRLQMQSDCIDLPMREYFKKAAQMHCIGAVASDYIASGHQVFEPAFKVFACTKPNILLGSQFTSINLSNSDI